MSLFDKLFKKDDDKVPEVGNDGDLNSPPYRVYFENGDRVIDEDYIDQGGLVMRKTSYSDKKDDDGSLGAGAARHALRDRKG